MNIICFIKLILIFLLNLCFNPFYINCDCCCCCCNKSTLNELGNISNIELTPGLSSLSKEKTKKSSPIKEKKNIKNEKNNTEDDNTEYKYNTEKNNKENGNKEENKENDKNENENIKNIINVTTDSIILNNNPLTALTEPNEKEYVINKNYTGYVKIYNCNSNVFNNDYEIKINGIDIESDPYIIAIVKVQYENNTKKKK